MPDDPDRSHDTDPLADTQTSEDSPPSVTPGGSPATKKRAVHAGDVLGRYELIEDIGEGGMATVFRARDTELRREVAIKVLFPHLARRPDVVRRFHREARAAAGLEHANILRVYDVGGGEDEDPPYIVMELIRGSSLLGEIEKRGALLAEVAACIGALLADALAVAHGAGIIHRDVKPANVMVAAGGRLLLADFGVARLETEDSLVTKTGSVLGTPAYMSPEQASGDTATQKSDLYSLGATLYQLATGSLPYTGSPAKVLSSIASGSLVPAVRRRADVGPDLSRVIDRLMASDPAARPANAADVAAELRAIAAAGGLGDPTDELADFFADSDKFVADRLPRVVSAVVRAAERAIADEKLPRAMALADRAAALAPSDPAVTTLVTKVTEGGKASRRRRVLAIIGGAVVLAGGATLGAVKLLGGSPQAAPDAALIASSDAAPLHDDAISEAQLLVDAAVADGPLAASTDDAHAVRMVTDAGVHVRADGGARRDAPALVPADAAVADAAPLVPQPADAAVRENGFIVVKNDTWCEVSVDGVDHGQIMRQTKQAIVVPPGQHTVVCAQPGSKDNTWTRTVTVAAGATATAEGAMLGIVVVKTAVDAKIDGVDYAANTTVRTLAAGRHDLEVAGKKTFFTLRVPCTVRATPEPGCY